MYNNSNKRLTYKMQVKGSLVKDTYLKIGIDRKLMRRIIEFQNKLFSEDSRLDKIKFNNH